MFTPWQFPWPCSFAPPQSTRRRLVDERCLHPPTRFLKETRGVTDASPVPSGTPIDRAFRRGPDAFAPSRCPGPTGRDGRPAEGILGHLDAFYALAALSLGDPDRAQHVVTRRSRLWRALADHVHRANEGRHPLSVAGPAPFREGALSTHEREAIALFLGGWREQEAARLLSVSVNKLGRNLRAGLEALQAAMVTDRRSGCALAAVRDDERFPGR